MEETRKRQRYDTVGVDEGLMEVKMPRADGAVDLGEDDIVAWLLMDDDDGTVGVSELMEFLDTEAEATSSTTTAAGTSRVKFIENPYSSPLIFQSSSSYITINGNEESCGSSFSDCDSSVMASVDRGGITNNVVGKLGCIEGSAEWLHGESGGGAWSSNEVKAREWVVEKSGGEILSEGSMGGCDGLDWKLNDDDDGLAWVLGEDFFL